MIVNNYAHVSFGSDPGAMIVFKNADTLIVKNNIYQVKGHSLYPAVYRLGTNAISDIPYIEADYNHFHYDLSDGITDNYLFATRIAMTANSPYDNTTWSAWNTLGYDANSDTGYVAFAVPFDTTQMFYHNNSTITNYRLVEGTGGTNAGIDLSATYPFLAKDIEGVTRSSWNLSAVETTVSTP